MIELAAVLVALGTFTGYITGRARGYHLGYSDAQKVYERAIQNLWSEHAKTHPCESAQHQSERQGRR